MSYGAHRRDLDDATDTSLEPMADRLASERAAPLRARMTPRCVLFLERGGEVGGAERVLLQIVDLMDRSRFRPAVVCHADGRLPALLRQRSVPTYVVPMGRFRRVDTVVRTAARVVEIARREGAAVLHANGSTPGPEAAICAGVNRVPWVWQLYDPQSVAGSRRRAFVLAMSVLPRPREIFYSTPQAAASLPGVFRAVDGARVILPGVDPIEHVAELSRRAVAELCIPERARVVAVFARYVHGKGLEHVVRALRLLPLDVHVVLCGGLGTPEYTSMLEEEATREDVADRVHLVGHVSEDVRRSVLAAAVAVVHPADHEPFGLAVLEAMAAGKPVVAARAVGPAFLIEDGVSGLLFPIGDHLGLADALNRVLGDPALQRRLGTSAARRAREFTPENFIDDVQAGWARSLVAAAGRTRATRSSPGS